MREIALEVVATESSFPTLALTVEGKRQFLHSRVKPELEYERFKKQMPEKKPEVLIILGLGLGYHLSHGFFEEYGDTEIIIVEYLENTSTLPLVDDVRAACDEDRVYCIFGENSGSVVLKIMEQTNLINRKSFSIVKHPASWRIFHDYYETIEKLLFGELEKKISNQATINRFALSFFKNGLKHIGKIDQYKSLYDINGVCKGKDVLIVSSAPSLGLYLEEIKKHQHRYEIVAVDSALPVLQDYGIGCDYLVSVDPQPWVWEHLFGRTLNVKGIITTLVSYPLPCSVPVYAVLTTHPLLQIVESMYPGLFPVLKKSSGSVAGDALYCAEILGGRSLYLVGMDFCFPHHLMYSRGTVYQNRNDFIKGNRFKPGATLNGDYVFQSKTTLGKWRTRNNFVSYKTEIEKQIEDLNTPVHVLRSDAEDYGPLGCGSAETLPVLSQGPETTCSINPVAAKEKADPLSLLKLIHCEQVYPSLIESSFVPKRYTPKLSTIINNLLISVQKRKNS